MDKVVRSTGILVLYHKLWDMVRQDPSEEECIVTDEFHVIARDDESAEYVYDSNKRIRKYGGSNIFSTQDVQDYMKTKWGPEILKNCSWSILLKQNKLDIEVLQDMYQMTRSEAMKMTKFNRNKGEAYLVADQFRIPINIRLSNKLYELSTTKVKDLQRQKLETIY
jgi:type IV secretory pathway VirB4 component